jgi:uncharacterized membrane protein
MAKKIVEAAAPSIAQRRPTGGTTLRLRGLTTAQSVCLIAVLFAAAALRLFSIAEHGLWFDERVSVSCATGSILSQPVNESKDFTPRDFWSETRLGNLAEATIREDGGNGLLFHLLLYFWTALFGISDFAVRLLPALLGTLAVLLVYKLALSLCSARVALLASAFAAIHPLLIRYSQEARGYTLATLLSLGATLLFVELVMDKRAARTRARGWIFFGLLAAASLLSHYLSIYVFLALALFAALRVRDKQVWMNLLKGFGLAAIIFSAWMAAGGMRGLKLFEAVNLAHQQRAAQSARAENYSLPVTPRTLLAGELQVAAAMSGNYLQKGSVRLLAIAPMLIIPLLLLVAGLRAKAGEDARPSAIQLLILLAVSAPAFTTLLALRSGHVVSFEPRYASFATPYLVILLALGATRLFAHGRRLRYVAGGLVIAHLCIMAASTRFVYNDSPWFRPPNIYRLMAERITEIYQPGDVIIYPSWHDARMCNLYLKPNADILQRVEASAASDRIEVMRDRQARFEIGEPSRN